MTTVCLSGDSRYGIDRTATEFKETKAMRQILKEQRNRRDKDIDDTTSGGSGGASGSSGGKTTTITSTTSTTTTKEVQEDHQMQDLVGKLKRKCGPSQTDSAQSKHEQPQEGEKGEGKKKKVKR